MNEFENRLRLKKLYNLFSPCYLCPLNCGADRLRNKKGICNAGIKVKISSATVYKGEEPPLVGKTGSGAIFFSFCNLKCVYCQNYNFSQNGNGHFVSVKKLSEIMLNLQEKGVSNINLITATHFIPQVASSLILAKKKGLKIPVVYNTSGYESVSVLKLLSGLVDIYLTDFRYGTNEWALKYSAAPFYTEITKAALKEMFRQTGNLELGENGIAKKGTVVRLLIFPEGLAELELSLKFIKETVGTDIYVSLMSQYVPVYKAKNYPPLNRKVTKQELLKASHLLRKCGFKNGWIQYL